MEKDILFEYVNAGLSIRNIGEKVEKSPTTIRYWLDKYGLETKNKSFKEIGVIDYGKERYCSRCTNDKPISEFYQRRGKIGGSTYCKICTNEQSIERQRGLKQKAIEYKGGKCEKCGYDKYQGALEFHHVDPTKKDFTIAHLKNMSFSDKIKIELDKCILVCANCHREIHGNVL